MIVLKSIQLNNFLSHSKTELKFEENERLLIDGRSGSGKSSVTDALVWCLYGMGRVANKSLIKHGTTRAEVVVTICDIKNKVEWKITRTIDNKNKHTLLLLSKTGKNWLPAKVTGLKDTQLYIEKEILHSSYILFVNSIVHLQENIDSFVKQTSARRKDIILEIIGSAEYDRYYDLAKEKLSKVTNQLEVKNFTINELKSTINNDNLISYDIDALKASLVDATKAKEESTNKLVAAKQTFELIQSYGIEYNKKKIAIEKNAKELERLNMAVSMTQEELTSISIIDLSRINVIDDELVILYQEREKIDSNQVIRNKWVANYMAINAKRPASRDFGAEEALVNQRLIELLTKQEEAQKADNYHCPQCNRAISKKDVCPEIYGQNSHIEEDIKNLSDRIANIRKEKTEYVNLLNECAKDEEALGPSPVVDEVAKRENNNKISALITEKDQLQFQKSSMAEKKASAMEKLMSYSRDIERITGENKELEVEANKLKEATLGEESAMNALYEANKVQREAETNYDGIQRNLIRAEEAKKRIADNTAKCEALTNEIAGATKDLEALKLIKDAFGNNGIRTIVIDYVIPSLEDRINAILSKLSDFRVRLDTQRNGTTDTILEGLFISILNELGEELDYDSYSGGEKLKIEVSISEALAEIQKISFRILDETFIGLDEESIEGFAGVIMTLQERFSQLICISHLSSIKMLFDKKVFIKKINGTSSVEYA